MKSTTPGGTESDTQQTIVGGDNDYTVGHYQAFEIHTVVKATGSQSAGLEFYLRPNDNSGDYDWSAAASSAFDGKWHHVAVTWTATTGAVSTGSADSTSMTTH